MITYSMETIGYINLFEKTTHAHVKDCFQEGDRLIFVIEKGDIGKAVGKQGANIKKMSAALKKPVKVIEYDPEPVQFLKNLLYPIKPKEIRAEDDKLIIKTADTKEKGQIYGRERTNLKRVQQTLSKYFPHTIQIE